MKSTSPRSIAVISGLAWHEMTRDERVKLMLADSQAYLDKVPEGHFLDIADSIAKSGPIRE